MEADYRRFLERSAMTEDDIRFRLRLDLLQSKVVEQEDGRKDLKSFVTVS